MKRNRFIGILIVALIFGVLLGVSGTMAVNSWFVSSCQSGCEDEVLGGQFNGACKNSSDAELCLEFRKIQCQLNCSL